MFKKIFKHNAHNVFAVGGSERNAFMGKPAKDFDFVVHNTTEEELLALYPEAKKVGNSFPVYLIEGHEVALARTEKSTGASYTDFEFVAGVSIEEDLGRRDLSINSIARNVLTGEIVDPYNGVADIKAGIIRTINPVAFEDDSLRIYRAVRFAVEFGFDIEPTTFELMKASAHLLKHIPAERVCLELEKVYERCAKPARFFQILAELGGLQIHFKPLYLMTKIGAGGVKYGRSPELTAFDHAMDSFNAAKSFGYNFSVALAALFHDTGKGITKKAATPEEQKHIGHDIRSYIINKQFVKQHRFTGHANDLIILVAKNHMRVHDLPAIKNAVKLVRFYKIIKNHFDEFIQATNCDHVLSEDRLTILNNLKKAFQTTKIDIPKSVHDKGKDAVRDFVEQRYAETYKALVAK